MEAPERFDAVELPASDQPSHPGPAFGGHEGVFQWILSGEYPSYEDLTRAEDFSASSTPIFTVIQRTTDTSPQAPLRIYYQNIRGLRTKIDDLFLSVTDCEYDVIILTETWLDDEISSPQLFGTSYDVYRNDRDLAGTGKKTGGGICIAVLKKIDSAEFPVPTADSTFEQLWVVVEGVMNQKLYIGSVYISPDLAKIPQFIEKHVNSAFTVAEALNPNDVHLLLGDYNQPRISWTNVHTRHAFPTPTVSSYPLSSSTLLDGMALLGMKQMSTVKNDRNRTLDLILVNDDAVNCCTVSEAPEAMLRIDPPHPPLLIDLSMKMAVSFNDHPDSRIYNFHKADFTSINQALLTTDWSVIEESLDVNQAVLVFNNTLYALFRDFVPAPVPRRNPPWSNARLQKLKRRRSAALRKYSARRNPLTQRAFCLASNRYKHYKRFRYGMHVRRTQANLKQNPKRFWSFVNEKRKESGLPSNMFLGETKSASAEQTCNLFAEHFSSVFNSSFATSQQITSALRFVPTDALHMNSVFFSEDDVKMAISKLKSSSSVGPDGIPSIVLKSCAAALAKPLQLILNLSISTGRFPDCWKTSYMFPVFKKGDKRDVSNYRGITSLCSGSKLMEILMNQILMRATKNYISTDQHGFIHGRSTSTNLVEFTSYCLRNMDGGGQVDAVYTDLKAAFDRIDHGILLAKLDRLGVPHNIVRWIASYLSGRSLTVKIGTSESDPFYSTSGVPQGSNIGPIFFSVFYNDVTFLCLLDAEYFTLTT